jgi:dihydrofolate reductase
MASPPQDGVTPPRIAIIAALARNRVIGRGNRLPWHLPHDLRHFKRLTLGRPIIMGRRTWESLPGLLPDRTHIVITRDPGYRADGAVVVHSLDAALAAAGGEEALVVGGAALYAQALPRAWRLHLTLVDAEIEGDTFFPAIDPAEWREVARENHAADERHAYPFAFVTLERAAPQSS